VVCVEEVGRIAERVGSEGSGERGEGEERGRDESRQRIGFGLFAPWARCTAHPSLDMRP
jgi:hypothetical protein